MELNTERLHLRDFVEEDWPAVLAYQQKTIFLRYYDWTERKPEAVRAFIQRQVDNQTQDPRIKFQFAVIVKDTGRLIGNCGVRMASSGAFEADIGYELDPQFWGRGYATEAARALVDYGFTTFGLHRIWAWCIADNVASARVLEKLGMRLEGRQREKKYFKDRWWDTLIYAILVDEWQARQ